MRLVVALGSLALLAGCAQPKQLSVDGAWVRLGAVRDRPSVAYFVVHGGPTPATLISVSTDTAIRAEMHETMKTGAMSSMTPVTRVAIPTNATVAFRPGGRHVMLFQVNPEIKPGAEMTFTFSFANGERILQKAAVVGAGDPEPK